MPTNAIGVWPSGARLLSCVAWVLRRPRLTALCVPDLSDVAVLEEQLCDDDEAEGLDVEPAAVVLDDPLLAALVRQAEALTTAPDPKLNAITALLRPLLKDGCQSDSVLSFHRDGGACRSWPS